MTEVPSTSPSLAEVIRLAIDHRLADLHVALPGIVESYDVATQRAQVKPCIKAASVSGEFIDLPVIDDVPVGMPRGGGFFVSFPVTRGDHVWLMVADGCLDDWRNKGGSSVTPSSSRRHDLSDAIAIPCAVRPDAQAIDGAHAANLVVGKEGGAQIHVNPAGQVCLGAESPTDYVALAAKVQANLNALTAVFSALAGDMTALAALGVTSGIGTPTANAIAALTLSGWPAPSASSNVRSD